MQAFDGPIHYQDAHGAWQTIDTTVVGDTADTGYAYGVTANSWHVHFARQSGGPKLLHLQDGTLNLSETLDGAATAPVATTGPHASYLGVFPGVDLQYNMGARTLEEELILHDANGPASYTFSYHVPGASAGQDAAGTISFTDSKGTVLLRVGGVAMYEADAVTGRMLPKGAGSEKVSVTLAGKAPDYTVTLTPDHAWLTDPARKFPVAIDPTYSGPECGTGTQCGLSDSIFADTYVSSVNPTLNFYNVNAERVGNCSNAAIPNTAPGWGTGTNRSFLKFPVPGLPDPNTRVTGATLTLWQTTAYSTATVGIKEIQSAWDATAVTWNTQPAPNGAGWVTAKQANSTFNMNLTFDMSAVIYDWWFRGYAQHGLELAYQDETQACDFFASDDYGSNLPSLAVTYAIDQTAPTVGNLTINGSTSPAPTNNPVVTLGTTASDLGSTFWQSNWSSTSGVGAALNGRAAAFSVDAGHTMLTANTSTCGATACTPETFLTSTIVPDMTQWPTFTAMFKTDYAPSLWFGAVSHDDANNRFTVVSNSTGTAFTTLQFDWSPDVISTTSVNIPFSANTWYFGQVIFPQPNAGEIWVWPAGQPRPTAPAARVDDIVMSNPGLNFWDWGDNGANLHHVYVGQATLTKRDTSGNAGFGLQEVGYSNDGGTTYGCPTQSGWAYCVAATGQTSSALSSGDGPKTVTVKYVDNAGWTKTATNQILLDTTAPTVSITSPAAGREVRGWVPVSGNAADGVLGSGLYKPSDCTVGVFLYVDGQQVPQAPCQGQGPDGPVTLVWDSTNTTPGAHTLQLRAKDVVGNVGTSATITVYVSNQGEMPYETFATRTLPDGQTTVSVNTANGNTLVAHTDLAIPGIGPNLSLTRTYNALVPTSNNDLFGSGWTSDLDERVTLNGDGSATYHDPSGGFHIFTPNGASAFITPAGLFATLVKNADGTFTLMGHDQSVTRFNTSGSLTSLADRNSNTLTVVYSGGLPTTVTEASGRQLTLTTSGGHITKITGPGGLSYGYAYDASGNLTDYTDQVDAVGQGMAVTTHYAYDASHRLTAITLNYQAGGPSDAQTNLLTTLTYDTTAANATFNRLTQLVDPMGYDVQMSYAGVSLNAGGQLVGPQTQVWQLQEAPCPLPAPAPAADANNCTTPTVSASTGRLGAQTTYTTTTDGLGTLARIDAPLGAASVYSYNANGQVTQVSQKVDDVPHYRVATATYDANGNTLTQTVGASGSYTAGLATNTADAPALTTTYTYDAGNNVLTATDPMGFVTQYTYDTPTTGNLRTVVKHYVAGGPSDDHTNVTTSSTYDAFGEVLTTTDPLGVVTTHTYDGYGDVTQTVANYKAGVPASADTNVTTSATFDSLGEPLSSTDPTGTVTTTSYDIRGRVTQTVANAVAGRPSDDHTNVTTKYSYDALDRQVSVTDPRGFVTRSFSDADSRTTKSVQNCVDATTGSLRCDQATTPGNQSFTNVASTTAYDAAGNATLATDPASNQTVTAFDALNRTVDVKRQSGDTTPTVVSETVTDYDPASDVTSRTVDPTGTNILTSYTYDGTGRKSSMTDPPADTSPGATGQASRPLVTHYVYDGDSNVTDTYVTNAAVTGKVNETTAQYDALGRTTQKTDQAQATATIAQLTTFSYGANGQMQTRTDANGTTQTSYDGVGRVVGVLHPGGAQDTSGYDLTNRVMTTTNSSGSTKTFYDVLWRVVKEEHYDVNGVLISTTSHAYDANGNELAPITTLANGAQSGVTYSYDSLNRIASMTDGVRKYSYNPNGRIGTTTVFSDQAGTVQAYQASYTYDASNRISTLKDLVGPTEVQLHSYVEGYDQQNNWTSVTEDGTTTKYLYDNLNELTKVTDATGTTTLASYTYDANHNRATMMTSAGGTTVYTYDASGDVELVQKQDPNGKITTYTYDNSGNLTRAVYDPVPGTNQITNPMCRFL